MQFGDVTLSGGGPRGGPTANPGAGGWPTIRYYNKETGVDGQSYQKKTDMPMCSELGTEGDHYMQQYVEEAGKTSLCSIETYKGCSEKQTTYIKKVAEWDIEKVSAQIERLGGMTGGKMKADLVEWLDARITILTAFAEKAGMHVHVDGDQYHIHPASEHDEL